MIVYKLTSPSGKSYVGKTVSDLETRFKQHVSSWKDTNRAYKSKLYDAFEKYGIEHWDKEVLFEGTSIEEINSKEIELIDSLNTINNGYNITRGGDGRTVDFITETHKNNISEARKAWFQTEDGKEWKETLSKKFKTNNPSKKGRTGIKHTEETKQKIAGLARGRRRSQESKEKQKESLRQRWKEGVFDNRKKLSPEHYKAIGEKRRGSKQTDYQKKRVTEANVNTWLITFPDGHQETIINLKKFCSENGLDQGNMVAVSKGRLKQHKKFKCINMSNNNKNAI